MINIALIGAGQLGSRHLQALALLHHEAAIHVVDPNPASLEVAKQRLGEAAKPFTAGKVDFLSSLSDLGPSIDIAIIATSSDVRKKVIEELVRERRVSYLILEKVLFPRIQDYYDTELLLKKNNIQAWVNCPTRTWPVYRNIQERLNSATVLELHVSGSDWGLGCNAIHLIDLMAYFCDSVEYTLDTSQLDRETRPAKRQGFIEFTGGLRGTFRNGSLFNIYSYKSGELPIVVHVIADSMRCIINEKAGTAWIAEKRNNWEWREEKFAVPYQSQLTNLVVEQILDSRTCNLTSYHESMRLHLPLLEGFQSLLQQLTPERQITQCLIT